ncbi:MAG: KEOPS complex kinase/ATPase Bud32 [Candidatus Altiarchaeota archaeon]
MTKQTKHRKKEIIAKGAEAILYREGEKLVKDRVRKRYRLEEIDKKLRERRTKHEAKILKSANEVIPVPKIFKFSEKECKIEMEFLYGKTLKDFFESCSENDIVEKSRKIGAFIAKLHSKNIVHNDLTTSNMLLSNSEIYFIDFGLAIHSTRIEDKAMDLVVLKKAIKATHPKKFQVIWKEILRGYKTIAERYSEIIARIENIEKRARYL